MSNEIKVCISCKKPLKGRTDKKFCDGYCRNFFNNQINAQTNNFVKNINNALGKNRRILEHLLKQEEMRRISKENLLQDGFQFKYFTHIVDNKMGSRYFFCYDYGYLFLENDAMLIVQKKNNSIVYNL